MKYPVTAKLRMESKIIHVINTDNVQQNTVHFEYHESILGHTDLYVLTVNRVTDKVFLLTRIKGNDDLECLHKALDYLTDMYKPDNNYIVRWKAEDSDEIHRSYFRAKNEDGVKEKFEFDTLANATIVSIEQSPIC